MTIVVLNRRNLIGQIPSWLKDASEPIALICASGVFPERKAELVSPFSKVVLIDDYNGSTVEESVRQLSTETTISRIATTAEVDVLRAAALRAELGIEGQSIQTALAYRDKFVMKSILRDAGILVAEMATICSSDDLFRFADHRGYPIVLKPRGGGGSVGVHILKSRSDLECFAKSIELFANDINGWLAEAWVDGRFLTIDGLMKEGRALMIWPSFTTANFNVISGISHLKSFMLDIDSDTRRQVDAFVRRAIAALPAIKETTAFHAEVFLGENDKLTLCEIACRPGGCGHVPVFEAAFGINLYAETLRGQAGLERKDLENMGLPKQFAGFVWVPPQRGKLLHLPKTCNMPGVVRYKPIAALGQDFGGVNSIADHVAQAFLQADNEAALSAAANGFEDWWKMTAVWA